MDSEYAGVILQCQGSILGLTRSLLGLILWGMKPADIKLAAQRGAISLETMAKALEGDARAIAWTQWLVDGNDGPQSPPERWRMPVTAASLTDEQLEKLRWELPNGHYAFQSTIDAVSNGLDRTLHPNRWRNARELAASLINAREGSK